MKPSLTHTLVRGTPIVIEGRTLIPEARVTMFTAREATIGEGGTRVQGVQFVRVQPAALIEDTPQGERRHRIHDRTHQVLLGLFAAAIILPVAMHALTRRLTTPGR